MYASRCTTRIYIILNDLATDLKLNVNLFADDTPLLSIVSDPLETGNLLNKDLDKIRGWAEQWKRTFNQNKLKNSPQESSHPNLYFNKFVVESVQTQIH